jgi:hypothetical protein
MSIILFEKTLLPVFSEKMGWLFTSTFVTNAKWSEKPNFTTCVDV